MPTLRELLEHAPVLVLDSASSKVQVGWFDGTGEERWHSTSEEAGTGVFRAIDALEIDVNETRISVYCEGPGSILGIRTAAMALRTWSVLQRRPIYAYCSLALVARALGRPDASIIADARRESWHHFRLGGDGLRRVAADELSGDLVMPDGFRHWSPLPHGIEIHPYDVGALLRRVPDADIFRPSDAPDAFLHEEPSYVTWKPEVHRAPGSRTSSPTTARTE